MARRVRSSLAGSMWEYTRIVPKRRLPDRAVVPVAAEQPAVRAGEQQSIGARREEPHVLRERRGDAVGQGHLAHLAALGQVEERAAVPGDELDLLADQQPPAQEVDRGPLYAEALTLPQPGTDRDHRQGPVLRRVGVDAGETEQHPDLCQELC